MFTSFLGVCIITDVKVKNEEFSSCVNKILNEGFIHMLEKRASNSLKVSSKMRYCYIRLVKHANVFERIEDLSRFVKRGLYINLRIKDKKIDDLICTHKRTA